MRWVVFAAGFAAGFLFADALAWWTGRERDDFELWAREVEKDLANEIRRAEK